ncbi:hypothetical protein Tco_0961084 [Tanacetum coccineum]
MTGIQYTSPSGDGLCRGRLFDVMSLGDSIVIVFFVRTTDGNELPCAGVQNVNVGTAGRAPLSIETSAEKTVSIIDAEFSIVDEQGCMYTSPLITALLEETSCSRAICSPGVAGTPPPDVIDTIAETIVSTIPRSLADPEQIESDTTPVAATIETRASTAKRSLDKELSLEAQKRKEIRTAAAVIPCTTNV